MAPAGDRYRVLGFTAEMPQLLRRADLFVGKPGGLSASAAAEVARALLQAKKPVVITSYLGRSAKAVMALEVLAVTQQYGQNMKRTV